jgi:hypothetical protein
MKKCNKGLSNEKGYRIREEENYRSTHFEEVFDS